MLLNKQVNRGK